ncbi:MAG: universal stress protein [Anaerolineae bacterium]|nr:MAG: universal stress protein [Anaerolineae bacterium]
MFKNILLGVDGSSHSLRAAKMAGDLARALNANLRVVTAFEPVPSYLGDPYIQKALAARMEAAEHILHEALESVGEIPGELKTEVLEGPAAEAILAVAETRQPDLIIMGSRGRGRLTAALLGSQSQKVVQHASCPVLIVR